MKFQYLLLSNLIVGVSFFVDTPAFADDISDSWVVKSPITADSLSPSSSSQVLFSQENITPESPTTIENTPKPIESVEYSLTPLQIKPFEPMTVETANVLPQGAIYTSYGANLFSKGSEGGGIGLQTYNASIEYGINDKLQIGAGLSFFDDVLGSRFNGKATDFGFLSLAPNFKYQFINQDNYNVAVVGSLEFIKITGENGLFTPTNRSDSSTTVGGTIQVPFTYTSSNTYQWHVVGGLTVLPDSINGGGDFYGTFFNIGTGISFKFDERFGFFGDINVPLGPGGNSVNTRGDITKSVVWSAGLNYLHSPNVGIDLSITNRLGSTPATKLLSFLPDGGPVGVGLNVRYTPDIGQNYQVSFDTRPIQPFSSRDKQLLFDGIILSSPNTIRQGMFSFDGGIGPSVNFQVGYGMSNNAQLEFIGQQLGESDEDIGNSVKLGGATKLRFLNQSQGDPFSFGLRGAFQEATTTDDGVGSFTAEAAFSYEVNDKIALMFNPKAGIYGGNNILGAGLGLNVQPFPGFQIIGEVTPMLSNDATVWAAGARYMPPQTNVGLGVYTTNATGTTDIGSVVSQSDGNVSVGFNIMWLLGNN
ncbi:hypothetical protein [Geminocystis sp. NIES-3709]|uniref:hypothetical protein n=1 Tax=Geminocystis sp. NIES-3709 TaxID=1617448 RepID=UPI0005FCCCCD|nr:hypothetical protein [Geminocystis sp. NIES-3709]BAQ63293.1 hypothetical protein GM3709_58 [Geminocystis sp. NIES-3709]